MTDLDDLKIAWKEFNRQLERQDALTLRQIKEDKLGRFRSGLNPLVFGQIFQLIAGAVITIVSADFWVGHLNQLHLLLSGLLLQAYGILFIAFAVRDLMMTIESTVAKIGRSMKKWLMFNARFFLPPPAFQSELVWDRLSHRDALSADRPRPLVRRRRGPFGLPAARR